MEKKLRHKTVSAEAFVKAWQSAKTIDEVVKATNMNVHSAQYRARLYRKRGIGLQTFAPRVGAPSLDVAALKKLAAAGGHSTKMVKRSSSKKIAAKKSKKPAKKRSHAKKK